jgi:hypothetical protein
MIEANLPGLSVGKQCAMLSILRSSFYYKLKAEVEMNLDLIRLIDKQFLEIPFYGVRQMCQRRSKNLPERRSQSLPFLINPQALHCASEFLIVYT